MSAAFQEVVTALLAAGALFIGLRWGVIGIHGTGVERSKAPVLFWAVMGLAAALLATMLALLATGN